MNLGKENEYIEFKKSTSEINESLEAIVAMLNKHSKASVYFGVQDNGDVCGQQIGKDTLNDISRAINNRILPKITPEILVKKDDSKSYILVNAVGYTKPYCADGKYLIRVGSQNLKLSPDQLRDLVYSNEGDIIVEQISSSQQLTFAQLIQTYISNDISINPKMFKHNLHLLTPDKSFNLLAEILSDNNNFSIKVCRFDGADKSKLIERKEFGNKCLIVAMEQAFRYVECFNETKVDIKDSVRRKDIKLFDDLCFREAWVNACVHNKWSMGVPPVINIFDDRIEITSTGGLPIDFPKKDFFNGKSRPVNPSLQKIMGQLNIVEQTGHGVPKIVSKYGEKAYQFSNGFITVVMKFNFISHLKPITYQKLSKNETKVLQSIQIDPNITTFKLITITGLSQATIARILLKLQKLNKIKRIGSNKNGYWQIIK